MSYISQILEPGEGVLYRGKVTRTTYAPALLLLFCALAAAIFAETLAEPSVFVWFVVFVLALSAVTTFLPAWFRRLTTVIAVTDRRIIFKRGWLRRHTIEMNIQKVESVDVDQTLLGRVFNYGDITIRGTGATFEKLAKVESPLKLRTTVVEQ